MECLEGYAAFQACLCVKPFCSILFCICAIRTAVVLYFGDAVVPEFKLLLRGPLVQFIATGRTLLLSPMQLTTCLDVAQTAIFFSMVCILGYMQSSNFCKCIQMLYKCLGRVQACEFQLGLCHLEEQVKDRSCRPSAMRACPRCKAL